MFRYLSFGLATLASMTAIPLVSAETASAETRGSGISVRHWSHVILHVADSEASLAFYRGLLGAEVFSDDTIDGPGFEEMTGIEGASARIVNLVLGGQKVELIAMRGIPSGPAAAHVARGLAGFAVRVDDLTAAHAACKASGYECGEPTEIAGFRQFVVVDPDGVRIEISQPPDGLERFGPFSGR